MVDIPSDQIWMVVVSFIIAFVLAFGIGANDVANSFGTSVGAKVLTLKQACILASVFETLGAILIGSKVSDTIRNGIISVEQYQNQTEILMVGNVAALSGSCVWLIAATMLRMPVSATHSIVGATVGYALVANGSKGINWTKLGTIIASWFASPILAGLVSTGFFYACRFFILDKSDPLEPGLRFLPVFYAITITINLFSVFYEGPEMLYFDIIPLWGAFVIAFGAGLITALLVLFVITPWLRKKINNECSYSTILKSNSTDSYMKENIIENSKSMGHYLDDKDMKNEKGNIHRQRTSSGCMANPTEMLGEIMPSNYSSKIITGIMYAPETDRRQITSKPSSLQESQVSDKSKISKSDDAPLMVNEYKNAPNANIHSPSSKNVDFKQYHLGNSDAEKAVVKVISETDSRQKDYFQDGRSAVVDRPETARLFSFLQVLTAIFGSFAHGGNDVSNAISPLVSLWLIATTGLVSSKADTPLWVLFYGGCGISIGLWVWGRRVIKTLGEDLTKITPSSGFCIELGSALTVLIASNVGIPISTTHCKVGSVVFVGRFRSRENVDWRIFRNIVLAWLVTLPVTGGISAAIMAGLTQLVVTQ